MVVLKSANSDVELLFYNAERDSFFVELRSEDHSGKIQVYCPFRPKGITTLFAEAARDWRGWEGEKSWESLEGEFRMTLNSDSWGHISTQVWLSSTPSGPDQWAMNAELTIEAGQLEGIAKRFERYWARAS